MVNLNGLGLIQQKILLTASKHSKYRDMVIFKKSFPFDFEVPCNFEIIYKNKGVCESIQRHSLRGNEASA